MNIKTHHEINEIVKNSLIKIEEEFDTSSLKFLIKLDDFYVGEERVLTINHENAKVIEGLKNIHSCWNRIYEAIRSRELSQPNSVQLIILTGGESNNGNSTVRKKR